MKNNKILLFFVISIFTIAIFTATESNGQESSTTTTLYVDDDYDENTTGWNTTHFDKICNAADIANSGDTIYVYSGTYSTFRGWLVNKIEITKTINLIGENKETTIIDGDGHNDVISVDADGVKISGFTIRNGGHTYPKAGIKINSNYNVITDNIITDNGKQGIHIENSRENEITDNTISSNGWRGIELSNSNYNTIQNNMINLNERQGMILDELSNNNNILENNIISNEYGGILLDYTNNNLISNNIITQNNGYGILFYSNNINNTISDNTISDNGFGIDSIYDIYPLDNKDTFILKNIISNNKYGGIELEENNNTILSENTITGNGDFGIYLKKSNGCSITDNEINNHRYGIHITRECSNILIEDNIFSNNEKDILNEISIFSPQSIAFLIYIALILCVTFIAIILKIKKL